MKLWYPSYVSDDVKPFIVNAVNHHPDFLRDDFAYIRLCRNLQNLVDSWKVPSE